MSHDLLYEIGTEEIPASYLPPATRQLEAAFTKFLEENGIGADSIETHATPRRIVLMVRGLPAGQEDRTEDVTGPPWKAAFAEDGTPTKAAQGFAAGRGLTIDDLKQVDTPRGPYVGATVTIKGQATIDLLATSLKEMTAKLNFPKTMKWGPERFRFARPIRWIVALFGEEVVPFSIEGVETGRVTRGHRILSPGPYTVDSIDAYHSALQEGKVVLRAQDRVERIEEELIRVSAEAGGNVVPDPALVNEVSYLVETPSAFVGEFDDEFLELPAPVITTAMRDHQRYFAMADDEGKLLARFVCVANSAPESAPAVRNGNQRVLRARLDDARFYWNEDLRTPLVEKVDSLEKVVWLEGFGTLRDKTSRIERLVKHLSGSSSEETRKTAARAALLSKTDLVTEMIKDGKEFTSLQGVIGREYATRNGESESVAQALEEQYRPRFAGDDLPASEAGALLAIADRLDTIVGVWAAGMKPTGSKDPFALRRAALGVLRILLAREWNLSIPELMDFASAGYDLASDTNAAEEAADFVLDRLAVHLAEEEGFQVDVVSSVLERSSGPVDARERARALMKFRNEAGDDFEALAAGFKRAKNILKKASATGRPERTHLKEDAETQLFEAFESVDQSVATFEQDRRYGEALTSLSKLRQPIDAFFDSVLVMADDAAVKENRLRLLGCIVDRIQSVADLSKVASLEERTE